MKVRSENLLTKHQIAAYRKAIVKEKEALARENAASEEARGTVELDQQSVGRLSRMDAMQRQAMAQATQRRRNTRSARLSAALDRMEIGEFGYCQDCGEDIGQARLDLDPTVPSCVSCARG